MSEEKQVQSAPAEEQPKQAQEVATDSQDQPAQSNVGELIAESKKYRARSQKDREKIAEYGLSPLHRRSFRLKSIQMSLL